MINKFHLLTHIIKILRYVSSICFEYCNNRIYTIYVIKYTSCNRLIVENPVENYNVFGPLFLLYY